jgi:SAM-dependent methyltransferase
MAAMFRPRYGVDAPGAFQGALFGGGALVVLGLVGLVAGGTLGGVLIGCLVIGVPNVAYAGVHLWTSAVGKPRYLRRMLDTLEWTGTERVLDVGCGRGLLLVEAAKRAPSGLVVGVDIWASKDQSANSPPAPLENARLEGVAERVAVLTNDARHLALRRASFDVVISSFALHNIRDREERRAALEEIVRVLGPGGRIAIADILKTREYREVLEEHGIRNTRLAALVPLWLLPARSLVTTSSATER